MKTIDVMKCNLWLLLILLFVQSCDELVHTQKTAPTIKVDKTILLADGVDVAKITIEFDRALSAQQLVKLTTTNGILYGTLTANAEGSEDSLMLRSAAKKITAYIRAARNKDDNVILTASTNGLIASESLRFNFACPDTIYASQFPSALSVNETDNVILFLLRRDGKNCSNGFRINCIATPSDVVDMNEVGFSGDNGEVTFTMKALKAGTVKLSFNAETECKGISIGDKTITVN